MKKQNIINELLSQLHQSFDSENALTGILSKVDEFNDRALRRLVSSGCSSKYAKAILLKISNLLIARYQYSARHNSLVSKPYGLFLDPANGCSLHCPGCLHNQDFKQKINPDWPPGMLSLEKYDQFLNEFGPYASNLVLFNWGEPLLNRQTPEFVKMAKSYMLRSSLSSNLSVEFDPEALVLSGLDVLTMAIDGTNPESYGRYRKGGDFELVISNLKDLVAAKKKHKMGTPILSWQFLLFEHNKNEVEQAKQMATEFGINEVRFCLPYDVPWNHDIEVASDVEPEVFTVFSEPDSVEDQEKRMIDNLSDSIDEAYSVRWQDFLKEYQDIPLSFYKREGNTCKWLYGLVGMDALGRIMPCCYAPRKNSGFNYFFSMIDTPQRQRLYNSDYYRFSRSHFVEMSELCHAGGVTQQLTEGGRASYCVACKDKNNESLIHRDHLSLYYNRIGKFAGLNGKSIEILSEWCQ